MLEFDWIVFDSTGTLMRPEPDAASVYHQFGSQFGLNVGVDVVSQRLKSAMVKHFLGENANAPTDDEVEYRRWRQIVADTLPEIPADSFESTFRALWQTFAEPESWTLFDDVVPTLSRLKQRGYSVAVASNFDERLPPIVRALGLETYVDQILISSELGFSKPNLQFYQTAMNKLGAVHPDRVLMIGDTFVGDVQAPQQFGWHARHLVRDCPDAMSQLTEDL
ncbi:HAD-IA family hydrolase [Stieleria sp. JC731]|uniref:HAD-IA family hydrolase n=1 Tax=Pirellulaceae TaxID=2691357 RepID=UPI001E59FCE7|nr:HAD-IA family hydrolase [Stieleria sp. JC731]MCC9599390.1 HAD-IA family hydrolase [Stieleria sp. JC731]